VGKKQFLETDDLGSSFCRDLSKSHRFVNISLLLLGAKHLNPSDLDQETAPFLLNAKKYFEC